MAPWLRSQGLKPQRISNPDGSVTGDAEFRWVLIPLVCDAQVRVMWKGDAKGTLTERRVIYGDTGCL